MPEDIFSDLEEFLDKIFVELGQLKIDVDGLFLDHIAYRTTSLDEYESSKKRIKENGRLVSENIIRNRPIAVYQLMEAIIYKDRKINCVEIIAPAEGDNYDCGWEHAEFVVQENLEDFMRKYDQVEFVDEIRKKINNPEIIIKLDNKLAVKFHKKSLLEIARIQRNTGII